MEFSELITLIQVNLGNRTDSATETIIKNSINWILRENLQSMGLDLFVFNATTLKTAIASEYVVMPDGFNGVYKNGFGIKSGNNFVPLTPMSIERLQVKDVGTPIKFKIMSGQDMSIPSITVPDGSIWAYLRPIPTAIKNLNLWFYWKQPVLSLVTDEALISKIYGDSPILSGATWWAFKSLYDVEQEAKWYTYYQQDISGLLDWQSKLDGDIVPQAGPYDHTAGGESPSDYQD